MDFDDLLVNAVRLLNDFPRGARKLQQRFRHLLVDEFQDTNRLQLDLVTMLASGDRPDVCVVGDDDQSIYGWRGGGGVEHPRVREAFSESHPSFASSKINRSTNEILQAANRLIRNNAKRRGKNLWSPREGGDPRGNHRRPRRSGGGGVHRQRTRGPGATPRPAPGKTTRSFIA